MPIVLTYQGYKIYFYSNEGLPLEPVHVHIDKAGKTAKVWLKPITILAIIGLLILYGVSKIPEANRKYYEDLKSKKLNSTH